MHSGKAFWEEVAVEEAGCPRREEQRGKEQVGLLALSLGRC